MGYLATWKFFVYFITTYDALNERPHVHITKENGNRDYTAKLWLDNLEWHEKGSLTQKELNEAHEMAEKYHQELLEAFEARKRGEKYLVIKMKK